MFIARMGGEGMYPIMISQDSINKLKEQLADGEIIFLFVTPDGKETVECKITERYAKGKKVRCSEDNIVFDSIVQAADFYKCKPSSISTAIKKQYKCRGKHFHYWYDENHAKKFDDYIRVRKERKLQLE